MNGPETYAKLSSVAEKFIKSTKTIERPKVVKAYEYIGEGANIQALPVEGESKVHQFLGMSAGTEEVKREFGQAIDIIV